MMSLHQEAALKRIHGELLELLRDAVRVLEEEDISYSLIGGTLLGAVRHQGFIPWDDDIDIVLSRDSYERFAAVYPSRAGEGFVLALNDTWVPRVRKAGSSKTVFLDLFILDPLPYGRISRGRKLFQLKTLQGMLKEHTDYARFPFSKRLLLRMTNVLGKPFSKQFKLRVYRRISQAGSLQSPYEHIANSAFAGLSIAFPKGCFAPSRLAYASFEGLSVRIPKNAPEILTMLYGSDYMTLPPEEQRVPMHLEQ